jgi:hypothetical protein
VNEIKDKLKLELSREYVKSIKWCFSLYNKVQGEINMSMNWLCYRYRVMIYYE